MRWCIEKMTILALIAVALCAMSAVGNVWAQEDVGIDDELDQGLFEDAQQPQDAETPPGEPASPLVPPISLPPFVAPESVPPPGSPPLPANRIEAGEAREGETRWNVVMNFAIVMNYVFNDSPDSFTAKYRFEIKGQANAETAVLRGDADITAEVEGPLSRWPTGECRLSITIPKIPYELTFRRTGEEKGNLRLVFKRAITEEWQSTCTFEDAPGTRFETRGAPETWFTRALEKARPPLKDLIADIGKEEMSTRVVIPKEVITDAPLGSGEIEGTGVITIKPGGE